MNQKLTDRAQVDLHRLKAIVCRLLDEFVEQTGSDHFFLPEADFYWIISPETKMVSNKDAPVADLVGSLRDDWELTSDIADCPDDQKVSPYALTEVAALLDHIGQSVVR